MASEKATEMEDSEVFLAKYVGLLWHCVIRCGSSEIFDVFAKKLEGADPALLGLSIQYLSEYLAGVDEKDDKVALLATVRSKRIKWPKEQVEAMNTKFSWELPDAEFGDSDEIQTFLRCHEVTMTSCTCTRGNEEKYEELREARADAAELMQAGQQVNCSFKAEATEKDGNVSVTITKTRDWFLEQQTKLVQYKEELRQLTGDTDTDEGEAKKARLD